MLQGTLVNNYRSSKSGQKVYVYAVSSTKPEELSNYKNIMEAKGFLKTNEAGQPLHFVTEYDASGLKRIINSKITLLITTNNNVVMDDSREEQAFMAKVREAEVLEVAKLRAQAWQRKDNQARSTAAPKIATETGSTPTVENLIDETVSEGNETIADEPVIQS